MASRDSLWRRIFWPSTPSGCRWLAILAWPVVAIATDLLDALFGIGDRLEMRDFGLWVMDFSFPLLMLCSVVLWVRGFLLHPAREFPHSLALGIVTLPLLLFVLGIFTMMNFPLGRISRTF